MKTNLIIAALVILSACQQPSNPLFLQIPSSQTGISFINQLSEDSSLNILDYLYYYNGGGVAVGDINNDGLEDLFFTGNEVANRLYLNKGNFQFEDISEKAGLKGQEGWTTGSSMVDINGDGWLDIYVCQVSQIKGLKGHNQLYLNQGDGTFRELAKQIGLGFEGLSTQAAFLDFDRDGDLDMYLLNHSLHGFDRYKDSKLRKNIHPLAGDRFYINEGINPDNGLPSFREAGKAVGIYQSELGYGLGIAISDVNNDQWPDIYVCNDFHENDYLYINQKDGTFKESLTEQIGHSSRFSMGVDIADINGDQWPDILSLDMKPDSEEILKTAESPESYEIYQFKLSKGYHPQYPRNQLQLNLKNGYFSEIGQLSGLDATDWSWSSLIADYNLDGLQDVYITNGIYRRPNDMDFISYISRPDVARQLKLSQKATNQQFIEMMPQVQISNYAFQGKKGLRFQDQTLSWGLKSNSFSNGMAYADLDQDGDLDLIINNINQPAFLFNNQSIQQSGNNYLSVALKGEGTNTFGLGGKLVLYYEQQTLSREQFPVRGFQSSVSHILHFGLGKAQLIDSLIVDWPSGKRNILRSVNSGQKIEIHEKDGHNPTNTLYEHEHTFFKQDSSYPLSSYKHIENEYTDFNEEPLIPSMLSREGPAFAQADINGDGLQDLFLGASHGSTASFFIHQTDGSYQLYQDMAVSQDSLCEDVDAIFFDVEMDGDQDLWVVSGGNQFDGMQQVLLDRLYINEGNGSFEKAKNTPLLYQNGSCVRATDFDKDGDIDLFIGNRSIANSYGLSPDSYLLLNDGKGSFEQADPSILAAKSLGMVTDAIWVDINNDQWLDLIIVGEWMPIVVFINHEGKFSNESDTYGLSHTEGWWQRIIATDWDQDGDQDLFLGNLGLNSVIKGSKDEECSLYIKDFDGNGKTDPIICMYNDGESYPIASRDEITRQIVSLKKSIPNYSSYAGKTITEIFGRDKLKGAEIKFLRETRHLYLENTGEGRFISQPLGIMTQVGPIHAMALMDVNKDQLDDLIIGGNFYEVGPYQGRYDASLGHILIAKQEGNWEYVAPSQSGFNMKGEVKHFFQFEKERKTYLGVIRNNQEIQSYMFNFPHSTPQ